MRTLAGWIERHAAARRDHPALTDGVATLSYGALAHRVAQLVDWLEADRRLAPGARVAWLGHNRIDQFALLFACAHAGMILVPLNWRLAPAELEAVLDDAGASLLVVDETCAGNGAALNASWPRAGLPALAGTAGLDARQIEPDTPLLLVYTSGTTGRARGAVLTQAAVQYNALNAIHMHDLGTGDRVLTVLPTFHVGGLNIQTLPALYCGASVYLDQRFEPRRTLSIIERWRPSLTVLVPATIDALLNQPEWADSNLECLRAITTGSTDVPRRQIECIQARGVPVIQIYGSTETGPCAIYQTIDEAADTTGSIGRAGLHTDIRLVDTEGRDTANGAAGEILVRGPHVASGYWDRASGSVRAFEDGWFHSGDVAERDARGLYWFRDRIKHVIIAGGENIYPAELERLLDDSALVREAAIVGRDDERWGQVPVVVAAAASGATRESVLALFDGTVARYKRPRDVVFVDALPRNAMGKVELTRVREMAAV